MKVKCGGAFMQCKHCGADIVPGARFCNVCSSPLEEDQIVKDVDGDGVEDKSIYSQIKDAQKVTFKDMLPSADKADNIERFYDKDGDLVSHRRLNTNAAKVTDQEYLDEQEAKERAEREEIEQLKREAKLKKWAWLINLKNKIKPNKNDFYVTNNEFKMETDLHTISNFYKWVVLILVLGIGVALFAFCWEVFYDSIYEKYKPVQDTPIYTPVIDTTVVVDDEPSVRVKDNYTVSDKGVITVTVDTDFYSLQTYYLKNDTQTDIATSVDNGFTKMQFYTLKPGIYYATFDNSVNLHADVLDKKDTPLLTSKNYRDYYISVYPEKVVAKQSNGVLKFDKTVADKKYYFVETLNPMEAPFISFEVKEGEYVYIPRGVYVLHCVEYKDAEKVEEASNIQSKINESQAN